MGTINIEEALSAYRTKPNRCGTVPGKLRVIINRYLVAASCGHAEQTRETHSVTVICDLLQSAEPICGQQRVQAPFSYHHAKASGSNGRRSVSTGYIWLTECIVTYGGKEIRTATVDGNLLTPEELNVSVRTRPSQLDIQWILDFDPPLMELRLEEDPKDTQVEATPQFDLRDPQALRLVQALKCDIDQGCPAGTVFAERIGGALSVYLAHRSNRNSPNSGVPGGRVASPRFTRVVEYIRANLDRNIHIDKLAGVAGLSLFHFAKLFKRITGSSPHQYILHRRLERATELLRNTQLSLSEIALQAGFADQSHLTNVFRRVNGVTPSRFRAKI